MATSKIPNLNKFDDVSIDKSTADPNISRLNAKRCGNIVYVFSENGFSTKFFDTSQTLYLGTIAVHPKENMNYIIPLRNGDDSTLQGYGGLTIAKDGKIYFLPLVAGYNLSFCITFPIV